MDSVRVFVGFDQREAAAYHVFCQSVIGKATMPVAFHPIARNMLQGFDGQQDGTNAFIYSRYLVPYLCNFNGWAIFADGDMVCDSDISDLWDERERFIDNIGVAVVKHDYKTRHPAKYIGSPLQNANVDYPRKNWSSMMLWNCSHYANRCLTPEFVAKAGGEYLHRFQWLKDEQIGDLFHGWNHLIGEDAPGKADLYHFTLGVSGLKHYADCYVSWKWHGELLKTLECGGENPTMMVKRAEDRVGNIQ